MTQKIFKKIIRFSLKKTFSSYSPISPFNVIKVNFDHLKKNVGCYNAVHNVLGFIDAFLAPIREIGCCSVNPIKAV